MSHDAKLVQRGLPVEQDHIVVDQMSLNNIPTLQYEMKSLLVKAHGKYSMNHGAYSKFLGLLFTISILEKPAKNDDCVMMTWVKVNSSKKINRWSQNNSQNNTSTFLELIM